MKLAQYLVRLKFDDVEERAPRVSRSERAKVDKSKEKRKRKKFTDKDFDSEEEYKSNVEDSVDGSDIEYDDGKVRSGAGSEADDADLGSIDSNEDLGSDESDEYGSEEGEHELSDMDEEGEEEMSESPIADKRQKTDDGYAFVKEDGESAIDAIKKENKAVVVE